MNDIITISIHVYNGRLLLSPVIQQWLARPSPGYDAEGILQDLRNLAEGCRWDGRRRRAGIPYSRKDIMDRLEELQARHPTLNFFAGVFPRQGKQPCTQILWYDDRQMGTEAELKSITTATWRTPR